MLLPVAILVASPAAGMFRRPSAAPVERLVKNATAYIKEHPGDAKGYYILGRVHYLAWSLKSGRIPHYSAGRDTGMPRVPGAHGVSLYDRFRAEARRRVAAEMGITDPAELGATERARYRKRVREVARKLREANWRPEGIEPETLDRHAEQARLNFRKAIEREPETGLYHLGLAALAEEYATRAAERRIPFRGDGKLAAEIAARKQWREGALAHYRRAFELRAAADATRDHRPPSGVKWLVSYRAAQGYRRLAAAMDSAGDRQLATRMKRHIKELEDLPIGPITPIVFSLRPHTGLDGLIDAGAAVSFDMNGTGRKRAWRWPEPGTAFLVWDPRGTGEIRSGRQLFGSVTWWLLPGGGYRALDLLDDDRDGVLVGDELDGLAAWFDRDQDGISDRGEVRPLRELPVAAVSVEAVSRKDGSPTNPRGVGLEDGTWVPSYDWIAEPAGG